MKRPYRMKKIEYIVNENGCHICTSHYCDSRGYPIIQRNKHMSRYLWEEKHGPIPEKMEVCHKCDTPACINVDHFFLGTQKDNMKDMYNKKREGENSAGLKGE